MKGLLFIWLLLFALGSQANDEIGCEGYVFDAVRAEMIAANAVNFANKRCESEKDMELVMFIFENLRGSVSSIFAISFATEKSSIGHGYNLVVLDYLFKQLVKDNKPVIAMSYALRLENELKAEMISCVDDSHRELSMEYPSFFSLKQSIQQCSL